MRPDIEVVTTFSPRPLASYHRAWRARHRVSEPWRELLNSAKERAKKAELIYALSREWAKSTWDGKCALTRLPFRLGRGTVGPFSPTIDKIDPLLGYTPDNSRFILFAVNAMKGAGSDDDMFLIASRLGCKRCLRLM